MVQFSCQVTNLQLLQSSLNTRDTEKYPGRMCPANVRAKIGCNDVMAALWHTPVW